MARVIEKIDMTEQGFYLMLKKKTMKVEMLEQICEALDVSPSIFFEDTPTIPKIEINGHGNGNNNVVVLDEQGEPKGQGQDISNAELKHRIEMLERDNESLKKENAELKKDKEFLQSLLKKE